MSYNGWSNYPTWNIHLWLSEGDEITEIANRCDSVSELASEIREYVDVMQENSSLPENGIFADLLGYAIGECNWYEIAEHYSEDLIQQEEEEIEEEEYSEPLYITVSPVRFWNMVQLIVNKYKRDFPDSELCTLNTYTKNGYENYWLNWRAMSIQCEVEGEMTICWTLDKSEQNS